VTNYHTLNGELLGETGPGGRRFYGKDALGSVVATYDQNGTLENTYRYKPYGGLLSKTGSAPDPRFMWTGSTGSRTTGASYAEQYNRARHYGSRQAGWTSVDPLWPRQEPYAYAQACPSTYTDSLGLSRDPWGCRSRTAGYSREASKHNRHAWGINCFAFVSMNICSILNVSALIPYWLLEPAGLVNPIRWLNCINKCLFDCWDQSQSRNCGAESAAGWRTIRAEFYYGIAPCGRLDSIPDSFLQMNRNRNLCCEKHIEFEQKQLTHCNQTDCAMFLQIEPDTLLWHLKVTRGRSDVFWERFNQARLSAPYELQALLDTLANTNAPYGFPFSGSETARIAAGQDLCCKTQVWPGSEVDR
ncbi:MAG: hypothetical protein K8H99_04020, partial [Nitrospirae bacterium]|nr:hypothetical protein [Fimbriimonadaceae bacterium]